MLSPFVHRAVIDLPGDGDVALIGGAISAQVCGAWDHAGPCPLAPHHLSVEQEGSRTTLRVLFASDPDDETRVRELIMAALTPGRATGPDGRTTAWSLLDHGPAEIMPAEVMHAFELASSPR